MRGSGATLGNDVGLLRAIVPTTQKLIVGFREAGLPEIHSRENDTYSQDDLVLNPEGSQHSAWSDTGRSVLLLWQKPVAFLQSALAAKVLRPTVRECADDRRNTQKIH